MDRSNFSKVRELTLQDKVSITTILIEGIIDFSKLVTNILMVVVTYLLYPLK